MRTAPEQTASLLVIADPGLPTRRLNKIKDDLEAELRKMLGPELRLNTATDTVRVRPDNTVETDVARGLTEENRNVDATILLTEMPRHAHGRPLIAETTSDARVTIISCPTLGVLRPLKRLTRTIVGSAVQMLGRDADAGLDVASSHWNQWVEDRDTGRQCLYAHTAMGVPRTVLGMIQANEPLQTIPKLSSAMAAAAAVGAFGIFYSSIWQMSNALSPMRLMLIALLSIVTMTGWLVMSNRLWDRPTRATLGSVIMLYNLSTVATLIICVIGLYLALVLGIFLAGLVVIDPSFMAQTIGLSSVNVMNYLDIAWLSAAMGVVAGALGSNFDSRTDLRRLTHGQREKQRLLTEDEENSKKATSTSKNDETDS